MAPEGERWYLAALSRLEHRPTDVVPQTQGRRVQARGSSLGGHAATGTRVALRCRSLRPAARLSVGQAPVAALSNA